MPSAHLFVTWADPSACGIPTLRCRRQCSRWLSWVYGARRFLFEYPTRVRLVGVHFKPWGISPSSTCRRPSCGTDGAGRRRLATSLDRIRNQVGDIASATETLRVLEQELRSRLAEAPSARSRPGPAHRRAFGDFPRRGPVGALTDAAG